LLQERKLTVKTVRLQTAALRFFYVKTLRRRYLHEDLPYPKSPKRLPSVLSQDEVGRLIESANNMLDYTMLMTLYATGMRRAELCRLKVEDIESNRMIVHIRQGKRNRDRDVPLTPTFAGQIQHVSEVRNFSSFLRTLFRQDWVVYAKPAFGGPEQVIRYLGRYTHRVAISNHRLVSFDANDVTISMA
jgi:integrase